jgi:hypothetical protein
MSETTGIAWTDSTFNPWIGEAQECAASMDEWCLRTAGREVHGVLALLPLDMLAAEMTRRGATVTPAPHGGDFCSPAA